MLQMEIKPGWQTTEFWMSIGVAVVGLLIGYGVLTSEEGDLWLALFAAIIPAIVAVGYSISRAIVKK